MKEEALECKPTQVGVYEPQCPSYYKAFSFGKAKKAGGPVPRSFLVKCQWM